MIEQLPDVLEALRTETGVQLDIYSQGIERTIEFLPAGDVVNVRCTSGTSWVPRPQAGELERSYLVAMFERLAREFAIALAVAAPTLAPVSPFNRWREGVI